MLRAKLENLRQRIGELELHERERSIDLLPSLIAGLRSAIEELQMACSDSERDEDAASKSPPNGHGAAATAGQTLTEKPYAASKVSDSLRYQERARSLMTALLLTEEHERRRLAVDLHDGLSQTIALTQIKLALLRNSMQGPLVKSVSEIQELVEHADRAARSISFELSPSVLHDFGLEPAVQWLVQNIQSRYGIPIGLEDDGLSKPLDEVTRITLFRSIRELLINASKHSRASHVKVRLNRVQDRLAAVVEDDGIGMEPESVEQAGFGLFSIHERLSHAGGSMLIDSAPGRGTRIHLYAPLTNGDELLKRIEA